MTREGGEGGTRVDQFDVDAILPDLIELEPDLGDLLDLAGPPPEPLPVIERPSPTPVAPAVVEPPLVTEEEDELEEPEPPPRLPVVPVGEPDGFAVQLGATLAAEAPGDAPPRSGSPPDPSPGRASTNGEEPYVRQPSDGPSRLILPGDGAETSRSSAVPGDLDRKEPETPAAYAPTPGEVAGAVAVTGGAGPAPCVEPTPVTDLKVPVPAWRRHVGKAAAVALAGAATAALVLTNPGRGGGEGGGAEESRPAPEVAAAEAGQAPEAEAAPPADPETSIVAEAAIPLVDVYESPDDPSPKMSLEHPTEVGGPLVFLVKRQQPGWLEVLLPVRPNGSVGWVKAGQVRLSKHDYRVVVRLEEHRLELYRAGEETFHAGIAVGTREAPGAGETFYIKELLKPPDPDTLYGNYVFGLSGFSNALENFGGGEGVVGIHGTNDPTVVGRDVGEGSIRMTNEDMLELVGTLPLGTPVEVLP